LVLVERVLRIQIALVLTGQAVQTPPCFLKQQLAVGVEVDGVLLAFPEVQVVALAIVQQIQEAREPPVKAMLAVVAEVLLPLMPLVAVVVREPPVKLVLTEITEVDLVVMV
jgi:hypothetical protein